LQKPFPFQYVHFTMNLHKTKLITGLWRLASWDHRQQSLLHFIHQNLELGIDTFDHADIYGGYTCESLFGEALNLEPSLRPQIKLITKCGIKLPYQRFEGIRLNYYDTSKKHIVESAHQSLANLHTDYIDLLLIHRPDPLLDADEVADAFQTLKQQGKVLNFGVSNFTPFQFQLLQSRLDFPLATNQVEFSLMHMHPAHDGTLDQCQQLRIAPMAWSPLAGGRLLTEDSEQTHRIRGVMHQMRDELNGAEPDQIALAWIMQHPAHVVPVLGSGNIHRIKSACEASTIKLTREQWFMLWAASNGHNVP
jgi:predicted oxidoreductase